MCLPLVLWAGLARTSAACEMCPSLSRSRSAGGRTMKSTGREFAKSYVLPALFLFAVPSIGYWFAGHEVRTLDERYRALVIEQVQADEALTAEAREQVLGYFRQVVFSETCRSKGPAPLS